MADIVADEVLYLDPYGREVEASGATVKGSFYWVLSFFPEMELAPFTIAATGNLSEVLL